VGRPACARATPSGAAVTLRAVFDPFIRGGQNLFKTAVAGSSFLAAALAAAAAFAAVPIGTPDVSKMALATTDLPGSRVAAKGPLAGSASGSVTGGYREQLQTTRPYGASKYLLVENETYLSPSAKQAVAEYARLGHIFSQPAALRRIEKAFLSSTTIVPKGTKATTSRVAPRALKVGDSALETGFVLHAGKHFYDLSVSLARLDQVVVFDVAFGIASKINPADATKLIAAQEPNISAELVPVTVLVPTIMGTAQQGQSLTATPGTWGGTTTGLGYAYQWQHCDAAGQNCAPVTGATESTYAVSAADVGFTLLVTVTATNRFGNAAQNSPVTAAVA
jgi:hypothetical protein